jgi:hypothetical protein
MDAQTTARMKMVANARFHLMIEENSLQTDFLFIKRRTLTCQTEYLAT